MMKKVLFIFLVTLLNVASAIVGKACTSMIISSRVTANGRPLMLKHRDSSCKDVSVRRFHGRRYDFIGIADASSDEGQVWTGTNSEGFSIMNTAAYNFKDDDVPISLMDREGILMFKALGLCRNIDDFENMLDTLPRPLGVEANFGVIDAFGGACYYEVNNERWVKFDVNDTAVAPLGYRIVTNFCTEGRRNDDMGVERWMTASEIMYPVIKSRGVTDVSPQKIFELLSRSYRNSFTGLDYVKSYGKLVSRKKGVAIDQDFIPRRSTSCAVIFEGVKPGDNPVSTVMWTILGYPACSTAVPLLVGNCDLLPSFVKPDKYGHSEICDIAMSIKDNNVFRWKVSNGKHYMDIKAVVKGRDGRRPLLKCAADADEEIRREFESLYHVWKNGKMRDTDFYSSYVDISSNFLYLYLRNFKDYSPKITKLAK